ncbi:MAG: hypothetical protein R3236_08940 [Phycisphaeraceae bacterium]|nr:hypothetical protein [Phycisphaeraceae bacterium]
MIHVNDLERVSWVDPPILTSADHTPPCLYQRLARAEAPSEVSDRFVVYHRPMKHGATAKPIYTHDRGVRVKVGRTSTYAVINDHFATKACAVFAVDLASGKAWRLDREALSKHTATAPPQWRPSDQAIEARDISPDDRAALLVMNKSYGIDSEQWSYVVDIKTGRVIRQFKTDGFVPRNWWNAPKQLRPPSGYADGGTAEY